MPLPVPCIVRNILKGVNQRSGWGNARSDEIDLGNDGIEDLKVERHLVRTACARTCKTLQT